MNKTDNMYTPNRSLSIGSLVMILIGIISAIIAFNTDSHAAWTNLLFNNYFFLGISLFAVFFVALQYVAEAGWATILKRVPEAIMTFLPYTSAVMLFIVVTAVLHFGGNHIYHWLEPGIMTEGSPNYDAIIAGKEPYLNATFFVIRSFIYVIIWLYCARRLRQISLESDLEGDMGRNLIGKD